MFILKQRIKNVLLVLLGVGIGITTAKIYDNYIVNKHAIIHSENSIMENGFCYYQPLSKKEIDYSTLNKQSFENLCSGQSKVDIGSFQNIDIQKKIMYEIYNDVKNIAPEQQQNDTIWVTSDIHGDLKMLLQGLLKSGLIKWNGELSHNYFTAYRGKRLPIVYPNVEINSNFTGVYVNLGDIINKNAFGMACLYLLHDIYNKTKNQNGTNDKVKIILGNHEYYDLLITKTSAYTETIKSFIDMFDVVYEKNGLFFSHAPLEKSLKPKNEKETQYLKSIILTDDKKYTLKHILYGLKGTGDFPTTAFPAKPNLIMKNSISGHTHGPFDLGYNTRKDVLNVANDRFAKDVGKRGIIFNINPKEKSVGIYTKTTDNSIIKTRIDKNLFE